MRRGLGWRRTTSSVIAANSFVTMHYTTRSTYVPSPSVVTPLLIVVIIRTARWSTSDTREADTAARHDGFVGSPGRTAHRVASSGGVLMVRSRSAAVGAIMAAREVRAVGVAIIIVFEAFVRARRCRKLLALVCRRCKILALI